MAEPESTVTLRHSEWQMVRAAVQLAIAQYQLDREDTSEWDALRHRIADQTSSPPPGEIGYHRRVALRHFARKSQS